MRDGGYRGKFKGKNILFYKLDWNISLILMLTESKHKVFQPKLTRVGISFKIFSNYKAHQENNNFIMEKIVSWRSHKTQR